MPDRGNHQSGGVYRRRWSPQRRSDDDLVAFALAGRLTRTQRRSESTRVDCFHFTTQKPDGTQPYSTVYIGGDGSAFASYGAFLGLAEDVDRGNRVHDDTALVFTDRLGQDGSDPATWADRLTGVIAHEVGHLLGYRHIRQE